MGIVLEWLWSGDQPSRLGGSFKLSKESRDWFDSAVDRGPCSSSRTERDCCLGRTGPTTPRSR
jgi:hypothetical protein